MNKVIDPEASYEGWVAELTPTRYISRILLGEVMPVLCETDREVRSLEERNSGKPPEHQRSDFVKIDHVMFEVDSEGVAVLHGEFVAAMPERPSAA